MAYSQRVGTTTYTFPSLKVVLAKASPPRAGDRLAGHCCRECRGERRG
jgi:ethanolamine ammonia-lyase large subunit